MWKSCLVVVAISVVGARLDDDDMRDQVDSEDDFEDSSEHIGPTVAQAYQHPYAASLLLNNNYICSAVILNSHWILVLSKCFDIPSDILSSYVARKNLGNYTIRTGSSYNNKGGSINNIKMVINNFEHYVSVAKLESRIKFSSQMQDVRLPDAEEDVSLGYLASIIAWTPTGHLRAVNSPIIDAAICERNTKMLPDHYICLGGVQDPNRHFCRRDNGGAVIQNNTLVAIASFINSCALYSKTHAFPKVASFSHWINTIIWDEENPPTTTVVTTTQTSTTVKTQTNATEVTNNFGFYADPSRFMLTLPFDPINVPLEPAEDNSVLPRMSLYESYLQSMTRNRLPPVTEKRTEVINMTKTTKAVEAPSMPADIQIYGPRGYEFEYN